MLHPTRRAITETAAAHLMIVPLATGEDGQVISLGNSKDPDIRAVLESINTLGGNESAGTLFTLVSQAGVNIVGIVLGEWEELRSAQSLLPAVRPLVQHLNQLSPSASLEVGIPACGMDEWSQERIDQLLFFVKAFDAVLKEERGPDHRWQLVATDATTSKRLASFLLACMVGRNVPPGPAEPLELCGLEVVVELVKGPEVSPWPPPGSTPEA